MSEPARQDVARVTGEVVAVGAAPLMDVISRAAADPNTDVDKLERLLGMYERITAQQAKAAFTSALAEMQPRLPVIGERGKTDKTTYAKYEDINDAIRPLLHEFGFALSFRVARHGRNGRGDGRAQPRDGHSEETTLELPVDTGPGRNAVQAVGSSVSYGKRYTAIALLNITSRAPGDRDDGGRNADQGFYIDAPQVQQIRTLMREANAAEAAFLEHLGVAKLENLPKSKFQQALQALNARKRAQAQQGRR
jgi:hypothetical protein